MATDPAENGGAEGQHEARPDATTRETVGTGSALAVGCIVAVALFVLLALAMRWIAGAW